MGTLSGNRLVGASWVGKVGNGRKRWANRGGLIGVGARLGWLGEIWNMGAKVSMGKWGIATRGTSEGWAWWWGAGGLSRVVGVGWAWVWFNALATNVGVYVGV